MLKRADKHITILTSRTMCPIVRYIEFKMYLEHSALKERSTELSVRVQFPVVTNRLSYQDCRSVKLSGNFFNLLNKKTNNSQIVRFDSQWRRFCNPRRF